MSQFFILLVFFSPTVCVNLLFKHLKMSSSIRVKPIDSLLLAVAMAMPSIRPPLMRPLVYRCCMLLYPWCHFHLEGDIRVAVYLNRLVSLIHCWSSLNGFRKLLKLSRSSFWLPACRGPTWWRKLPPVAGSWHGTGQGCQSHTHSWTEISTLARTDSYSQRSSVIDKDLPHDQTANFLWCPKVWPIHRKWSLKKA